MVSQLLKFGVVGTIGFLVDGSILTLLVHLTDWGPLWPRAISFPCALLVTWLLNRQWTFSASRSPGKTAEYLRYALVQTGGMAVNFAVYAACIHWGPQIMTTTPVIALAIASVVALIWNFVGAKLWVFMHRP